MTTLSMLETAKDCPRKAVLFKNLSGEKGKYYVLKKVIDIVIDKIDFAGTGTSAVEVEEYIKDAFTETGANGFINDFELESHKKILQNQIMRLIEWCVKNNGKIVKRNLTKEITLGGQKTKVRANLLIEYDDHYDLVIIDRRRPQYSLGGTKKHCSKSIEFYGLSLLAKDLSFGKEITPAVYYLQSKADKTNVFMTKYDLKKGDNVIRYSFRDEDLKKFEDEYSKVTIDVKSRKPANECADCQYTLTCNGNFQERKLVKRKAVSEKLSVIKLTKEQLEMVSSTRGVFRVNAVAGSGKTTVVALRTLSLIEEGCDPSAILMITFTDKARGEMIRKIKGFAEAYYNSKINLDGLSIETFNSWGHEIVCKHYDKLGFPKAPIVIDDLTKRDVIVKLLESYRSFPLNYANPFMDMRYSKGAVIEMACIIDKLKAHNVKTESQAAELIGWELGMAKHLLAFYKEYNDEIVKRGMVDYDDQLRLLDELKGHKIFENLPYEHIIIDEFQDSDPNQIRIIEEIMNTNSGIKSLVVVGDMMQSIYSFRNTSPENLINFGVRFPKVQDINLGENFRSQSGITNLANRILDQESKTSARILAQREFIKTPVIRVYDKKEEEVECMLRTVKNWIKSGVLPRDIAVLGRTRSELLKYQEHLEAAGVPTILRVPEIIRENIYVQSIFGLATFLRNNENLGAFALYAKSVGIDPLDFPKMNALAEDIKTTLVSLKDEKAKIEEFYNLVRQAEESDYLVAEFLDVLRHKGIPTLSGIIDYLIKYDLYQVKDGFHTPMEEIDAVTLITVHSAKGLEYKNVVLMTRQFKDERTNTNTEEKRLLYVGVTRAKDALTVILPSSQKNFINLIKRKKV